MTYLEQQPMRILVVDDEVEVLTDVAAVVTKAGFACRCCTNVDDAVAAADSFFPDLIIADTNLHGHSGLQMCERIRQHPGLQEVPVMFLSATQIPDIIRRTDAIGGTYHLRKPFVPDVLVELIDSALRVPLLAGNEPH